MIDLHLLKKASIVLGLIKGTLAYIILHQSIKQYDQPKRIQHAV
jgi:hypothetical protein